MEKTKIEPKNFVSIKDIKTVVKNGLTRLSDSEGVVIMLTGMASRIPDDLEVTNETLVDCRNKLSEIRQVRYALQNIGKENQSALNDVKRKDKEYFDNLIGIIEPKELILKYGVKGVEDEKQRIKTEKVEAEANRINKIREDISACTNEIVRQSASCESEKDIENLKAYIAKCDDDWIKTLDEYEYLGETLVIQAKDYLARAITNVETKKELIRLQLKVDETKRKQAEKDMLDAIEAEKKNEARLYEIEAEREKVRVAEHKVKQMEIDKAAEIKNLMLKEKSIEDLAFANKLCLRLWNDAKKIGAKAGTRPVKYKQIELVNNRISTINNIIEKQRDFLKLDAWKKQLSRLKTNYLDYVNVAGDSISEIMLKIDDDKYATAKLNDLVNACAATLIELKNFLNDK